MIYSPKEIIFYLLLAGIVGLVAGWLLRKFFAEKRWAMRYQNIKESNQHIQSLLDTSEERSSSLDEVAQTLASKLALKTSDNNTLVKAFSGIQGARNQLKEQLKNVNLKSRKVQALYAELKDRNVELGERFHQTQEDSNKIKELERSITVINNTNSALQQELTHSKSTNKKYTTEIKYLESASKEPLVENETLKSKLSSLNQNIANAEKIKVASEKSHLEQIKSWETTHTELQNKYLTLGNDYSELQSQITSTTQDSKLYKEHLKESTTQNEMLNSKLLNLNKVIAEMEKEASNFKLSKAEPEKIKHLNLELEQSQTRLKDSANKLQLLQSKVDRTTLLNTQVTTLTSERDQLTKDLAKKIAASASDNTLMNTLKKQITTSETKNAQLNVDLESSKQSLQNISTLKTELASLKTDKKKLQVDLQTALEKVSSMLKLEQQLKVLNEEMNINKDTLNSEIHRHKDYLMKSETRWASEVKILRDKLDSTSKAQKKETKKTTEKIRTLQTKVSALTTERNNLRKTSKNADAALKLASKKNSHHLSKLENEVKQLTHDLRLCRSVETQEASLKNKASENKASERNVTNPKKDKTSQLLTNTQNNSDSPRYPIESIEGIGVVYGKRFRNINVNFVDTLLDKGKNPIGRKSLIERTDISKDLILTWINHADLFRIEGVEGDYAELLEASGVDTIKELRQRNANELTLKMISVNKEKRLAPKAPKEAEVANWITQSGKLQPMLTYSTESTSTTPKIQATLKKSTSDAYKDKQVQNNEEKGTDTVDDLTQIDGIGKANEQRLHSLGIKTFAQIAKFTQEDEKSYGSKLSTFHGRITQEKWVKQAKRLYKETYKEND